MAIQKAAVIRTEGLVDRERLRETLTLIREAGPAGATKARLCRDLGDVSVRTVDRAIGLLEKQGARFERTRSGTPRVIHFRLLRGPAWDEHVSCEARLALRLAGLSLSQCGTQLWQDKLETIEALASGKMSSRDRRLFEQLMKAVRIQGGVDDPIESSDVLEPILRALEGMRAAEVEYQAAADPVPRMRKVVPYALTHDLYSGGAFLLVWDPARKKPLHLRLNRIVSVKVSERPAVVPDPELMEKAARYQIGGWTSDQEPFGVEVRIRGAHWVQSFKEAPPALPEFESFAAADGQSMTVRFMANHENGPARWILQLGASAEVVRPESLRARVAEQLRGALGGYGGA